ncbi:MAG: 4Fe-4S dicluster domain-containing protein [Clostridia bacterium]|nr:4Fe-4S dicluster domain-containing protein [Clostridia bacterium]
MNRDNVRDEVIRRSGTDPRKCMKCGKCSATCPSYDEMEGHPHEFVYMVENGDIEPLLASESIYRCLTCMACVERCPRGVEPAKIVESVRLEAIRKKGANRLTPEAVAAVADEELPQQAVVTAFRKYAK